VTQLVLRSAFAIAAATILTLVAGRLLVESPPDAVSLRLLKGHARVHADGIAATPPAERRARAELVSKELGYPLRLEEARGTAATRAEWRSGALFIVARVTDTQGQVALGPVPYGRAVEMSTVIALAIVIALLVALLATRSFLQRIASHEAAAKQMCDGDFGVKAQRQEGDALDGIGTSLNQLADRIGQLLSDERDLLRTVAHEVRAPIARMRFRVEKIQRKAGEESSKDADGLITDLEQVDSLFEELLTYVAFDEFDHERPELQTTGIPVIDAIERIAEEMTSASDSIEIEVSGAADATVSANSKLFDRAVTNLLLNAINYGGPLIRVEVREFAQEVVIDVQDSGPGIPEGDRPEVIKPFVRLSTKKTKGTGLGLAIVSRIMRLHGGRLHILDAPDGGASVQLVWQNAKPQPKRRWGAGLLQGPGGL